MKNCSIIDPSKNKIIVSDILIKNKLIDKIAKQISHTKNENIEVIDCKGKYVSAGFVDMRVKINEPGQEHKETLESASMAAASGGVTSLICTPNTNPPIDQPAIIHSIQRRAREIALSKILYRMCNEKF